MFKNSAKLLFLMTLISGTMITISSNSWLGAWMGLEINLLSFIPLMINTNNLMSTEASLKYFLTQALASAVLLFSIILSMMSSNLTSLIPTTELSFSQMMISSSLLLKMGAAPFHFWFPGVMEGLSWTNNLILMTWQKITPLMLISYCFQPNYLIVIVFMCVLISSLGGLNQTSLRKIMAFSSINHLGWMLAAMLETETLWITYFMMYCLLTFSIVFMFNAFQMFHINQTFTLPIKSNLIKFGLFTTLLSLGGLPPFLGFLPKWLVIQSLDNLNYLALMTSIVCLTLITLFFYLRIAYSAFMMNYAEPTWNYNFPYKNNSMIISLILSFFSLSGLFLVTLLFFIF